jgi:hypothetical protein
LNTDSPVSSITCALLVCSTVLWFADRAYPRDFGAGNKREEQDLLTILSGEQDGDVEQFLRQESATRRLSQPPLLQSLSRRYVFLILVGCIVLRVETLGRIAEHIECTQKNLEVCHISTLQAVPGTILSLYGTQGNWKYWS